MRDLAGALVPWLRPGDLVLVANRSKRLSRTTTCQTPCDTRRRSARTTIPSTGR